MRYVYAKFINYAGFYMGMGINELEIPFNRCMHNIVLIAGRNGSGKSTLRKALNILPDDSKMYLDGMVASKELHILDGQDLYRLYIVSNVNGKGERKKTEAYISKNGEELNPNGNISSYKDTIFSLFDLDANYISLSTLSSEDRGLANKKPSERKQYVSSIVDGIEVYNSMNKVLSKKANVLKSQLNGIESKMRRLGDPNSLSNQFNTLSIQIDNIKDGIKAIEADKIKADLILKQCDPDNSIQDKYNDIYNNIKAIKEEMDLIETKFKSYGVKEDVYKNNSNYYTNRLDTIKEYIKNNSNKLDIIKDKILELTKSREEDIHTINIKREKLNAMGNMDIDQLSNAISALENNISIIEDILIKSNMDIAPISKQEYLFIFNTISAIKTNLDILMENYDVDIIEDVIVSNYTNITHDSWVIEYNNSRGNISQNLSDIMSNINVYKGKLETIDILSKRPSNCNIDNCPFIESALSIKNMNLDNKIKELYKEHDRLSNELSNLDSINSIMDNKYNIYKSIKEITNMANNSMLAKVKFTLSDMDILYYAKGDRRLFSNFDYALDKYIEASDIIASYNDYKDKLTNMKAQYQIALSQADIAISISKEIEDVQSKLDNAISNIEILSKEESDLSNTIKTLNNDYEDSKVLSQLELRYNDLSNKKQECVIEYNKIKENMDTIKESISIINKSNMDLDNMNASLQDMENTKIRIQHDLINYEQYEKEYDECASLFNVVNTVKGYVSPTGKGIQSLYMEIYMRNTLEMCNSILGMLFGGSYQLCDYVINEKEFRIPFIGDNMPVNDISNGSSSQVAMVGMIINLVLLNQASDKFNIAYLDEIDGPLDTRNRIQFVEVVYRTLSLLNIEQLVMISHSIELDMHNIDVILLKGYEGEEDKFNGANIIYNYNQK